jgi:AraC-like DNA-binding protein
MHIPPIVYLGEFDKEQSLREIPNIYFKGLSNDIDFVSYPASNKTQSLIFKPFNFSNSKQLIIQLFQIPNTINTPYRAVDNIAFIVKDIDILKNPQIDFFENIQKNMNQLIENHVSVLTSIIQRDNFSLLHVKKWIYQVVCEIIDFLAAKINPIDHPKYKMEDIQKIKDLQLYLNGNFQKDTISIKEMAENVEMSTTKFKVIFKEIVGESPHQYILSLRLRQAKLLLQTNSFTISQIAYKVGFYHPSALTRLFKNKIGISPNEISKEQEFIKLSNLELTLSS